MKELLELIKKAEDLIGLSSKEAWIVLGTSLVFGFLTLEKVPYDKDFLIQLYFVTCFVIMSIIYIVVKKIHKNYF